MGLAFVVTLAGLFAWNGSNDAWKTPEAGVTSHAPKVLVNKLTVMAWNLAKCDYYEGGVSFRSEDKVRARLDEIAAVVRAADVDLLFVSEVVFEAAPCPVNQVAYLAQQCGFHCWSYGDNYRFGLPFARIRSGNAILSKVPIDAGRVVQLAGSSSLLDPTGSRRILLAGIELNGAVVQCGSVRNDSFDLANNAVQVGQILDLTKSTPTLLAGDFNATPADESMVLLRASARFQGAFSGPATFPASAPNRRLDTVLVPAGWSGVYTHLVLDVDLSDHEPVLATFEWR